MLTGATRYVTDVRLPHMLELAFVRSPLPHARIVSIDVDPARAVAGVRAVLGPRDLGHVQPTVDFVELEGSRKTPRHTLPGDRVRYVGEPIAAVIADDRYAAEDGADAVLVELEPLSAEQPVHDEIPDGRYYRQKGARGQVEAAFAQAPHTVRRRLSLQRVVTNAIETCGIVADYDAATVSMIDTRSNTVAARVPVGNNPQDVAWSADGRFAYAVNNGGQSVSVIRADTFAVTATIPTSIWA